MTETGPEIAVLIPCKDEAISLPKVISDFRMHLPHARIYIGDNNSTDSTADVARNLGCEVIFELIPGKGNVVRRLMREVHADYFLIVDGDDTYNAETALKMLKEMKKNNLDMVVAARQTPIEKTKDERPGHLIGNKVINKFFNFLFKTEFSDVLSGYRLLDSNFAKTFPSKSSGFEIEVELNAHASWMNASVVELNSEYSSRKDGSTSKLRTFSDGYRILKEIYLLSIRLKPIRHFLIFFSIAFVSSIVLISRAAVPYFDTGKVDNMPSLVVGMGLLVLYFVLWVGFLVIEQLNSSQQTIVNLIRHLNSSNDKK